MYFTLYNILFIIGSSLTLISCSIAFKHCHSLSRKKKRNTIFNPFEFLKTIFAIFIFQSSPEIVLSIIYGCLAEGSSRKMHYFLVYLSNLITKISSSGLIVCFIGHIIPFYCTFSNIFLMQFAGDNVSSSMAINTSDQAESRLSMIWRSSVKFLETKGQSLVKLIFPIFLVFPTISIIYLIPPLAKDYPLLVNADRIGAWGLIVLIPLVSMIIVPFCVTLCLILVSAFRKTSPLFLNIRPVRGEIIRLLAVCLIVLALAWYWLLVDGVKVMTYNYADLQHENYERITIPSDIENTFTLVDFFTSMMGFYISVRYFWSNEAILVTHRNNPGQIATQTTNVADNTKDKGFSKNVADSDIFDRNKL